MSARDGTVTRAECAHALAGHAYASPADILRAIAQAAGSADRDVYGAGESLAAFERKIAGMLGKEAAVFMPSGTMAQQIALRITADRTGARGFAAHPTTHVVLHERDGFDRLHRLAFVPAGSATAPLRRDDVRAIAEPFGTLLLELPQRELGGELPDWDELSAITDAARERGARVHLDGARLWECAPFYGRPYAAIAAVFDTVYVSFYKGLGALAGAMLAGPAPFVEEARVWLRRHGGNLYTLFPYAFAAEQAYDRRVARMADYQRAAVRVAAAFGAYPQVPLRPNPPVTNMFHAFLRGDPRTYEERAQRLARERGIWTIGKLAPTPVPGVSRWEISCGDATLALNDALLAAALDALLPD